MSRFLANKTLVQPIQTDPVRCQGFHLTVLGNTPGAAATEAVAEWIKASFLCDRNAA
jgi:hypothetical protein